MVEELRPEIVCLLAPGRAPDAERGSVTAGCKGGTQHICFCSSWLTRLRTVEAHCNTMKGAACGGGAVGGCTLRIAETQTRSAKPSAKR